MVHVLLLSQAILKAPSVLRTVITRCTSALNIQPALKPSGVILLCDRI